MILRLLQLNCALFSVGFDGVTLQGLYGLFDAWVETQTGGYAT